METHKVIKQGAKKARKLGYFQDDLNVSTAKEATDWFTSVDEADFDNLNQDKIGEIYIVNHTKVGQTGVYTKELAFTFPTNMTQVPLIKKCLGILLEKDAKTLEDLSEKALIGYKGETRKRKASIVPSNVTLLKKFESLGIQVIGLLIGNLSRVLNPSQLETLSTSLYSLVVQEQGLSKFNLSLKSNTNYYAQKAQTLATLQNGVGIWSLANIKYHFDTDAYCTLGHRLRWEFIVEEQSTKQMISFGAYCVEDFFSVDNEVKVQVANHKTALANALLEYALQVDTAKSYNRTIDMYSMAYWSNLVKYNGGQFSGKLKLLVNQMVSYVQQGILVPTLLYKLMFQELGKERHYDIYREYLRTFLHERYVGIGAKQWNLIGIFGNALWEVPKYNTNLKLETGMCSINDLLLYKSEAQVKLTNLFGLFDKEEALVSLQQLAKTPNKQLVSFAGFLFGGFETLLKSLAENQQLHLEVAGTFKWSLGYRGLKLYIEFGNCKSLADVYLTLMGKRFVAPYTPITKGSISGLEDLDAILGGVERYTTALRLGFKLYSDRNIVDLKGSNFDQAYQKGVYPLLDSVVTKAVVKDSVSDIRYFFEWEKWLYTLNVRTLALFIAKIENIPVEDLLNTEYKVGYLGLEIKTGGQIIEKWNQDAMNRYTLQAYRSIFRQIGQPWAEKASSILSSVLSYGKCSEKQWNVIDKAQKQFLSLVKQGFVADSPSFQAIIEVEGLDK